MHYKPATKKQINELLSALLEDNSDLHQPLEMLRPTKSKRENVIKPLRYCFKESATTDLKKAFNI